MTGMLSVMFIKWSRHKNRPPKCTGSSSLHINTSYNLNDTNICSQPQRNILGFTELQLVNNAKSNNIFIEQYRAVKLFYEHFHELNIFLVNIYTLQTVGEMFKNCRLSKLISAHCIAELQLFCFVLTTWFYWQSLTVLCLLCYISLIAFHCIWSKDSLPECYVALCCYLTAAYN